MPTILWDEAAPADGDNAGQGDDQIRSIKTSVRVGLDSEHLWPSGGGDAGAHRLGTARAFYGTQSRVSSSGTMGRLMVTSDTSQLYHVGSNGTMFLGSARGIEHNDLPPQTSRWQVVSGVVSVIAGGTLSVAGLPFGARPLVMVSVQSVGIASGYVTAVNVVSAGQFTAKAYVVSSGGTLIPTASATSFQYLSIGTV